MEKVSVVPDVQDRTKREKELAAAVLLLFASQEDAFASGRVLPISPPASMVTALEATARDAYGGMLSKTGLPIELAGERAATWAGRYGPVLAKGLAETSEEYRRGLDGLTREEALARWKETWAARAESIGVTETTRAASLAEADAVRTIEELTGKKLTGIWYTEQDGLVCEVCGPLHGEPESVYNSVSEGGPPSHPNCRCWLEWMKL